MREPIAIEPTPPLPTLSPRKLREPDDQFIRDLTFCLRGGARLETAAALLLGSRKQWKHWRQRTGGVYDEMRTAIRAAQAHAEMKLQVDLAKRSPGAALKHLRHTRTLDNEPVDSSRPYDQSGLYTLKKALPQVLTRITDETLTDLSPLEQVAKGWRDALLHDCGGRASMTEAQHALVTAIVGSRVLLATVDDYISTLAMSPGGVVDRKRRKAWPIIETRARLADSLVRQLQALGLDRKTAPAQSLDTYIKQTYGQRNGHAEPVEPTA